MMSKGELWLKFEANVAEESSMEIVTSKAARRSTRVRVEMPVSVISLDRKRPFGGLCTLLVVSASGCGFRSSEPLELETPVMLSNLPGGGSVTARVANCVPLGNDGQFFLVGASLYTHGNVWGIANPPEDWGVASQSDPVAPRPAKAQPAVKPSASPADTQKKAWPYNLFSEGAETSPGRK